ncbi:unnamed protein product [Urochloa humidicola]
MQTEFAALQHNRTWTLVDHPPGARIITGKWVFKHKLRSDGTLERYKARWVVRGFNQRPGVDFGRFLATSTDALLRDLITKLKGVFAVKDIGPLAYFLGIDVQRSNDGFFLSQARYVEDLLERVGMSNCKPVATPADTKPKQSATDGMPLSTADTHYYKSMSGALQYLTVTRPDIAYAVQQLCLHMHSPRDVHAVMLKRVLRYVKGTPTIGIHLSAMSSPTLTTYLDADWAGCPDTRRSTSGFCVFLGDTLVSWSSKRQTTVSQSSAEAEYRGVANAVAECSWLRSLLGELGCKIDGATVVFCDNVSAVYMSWNPVHHKRTKHIELDIHFVREKVQLGQVHVMHVPSSCQFADVFTKGLPSSLFIDFRNSLCVDNANAETGGGVVLNGYATARRGGLARQHPRPRCVRAPDSLAMPPALRAARALRSAACSPFRCMDTSHGRRRHVMEPKDCEGRVWDCFRRKQHRNVILVLCFSWAAGR